MAQSSTENVGCLGSILRALGVRPRETAGLPYRLRDDFLSPAEKSFHRALTTAVGTRALVCPKVNLADIFFVVRPNENRGYRNRIDRKHVDFLLCDPSSLRPVLGIELDDASHQRPDRQSRDEFVDSVFQTAGLRLVHVPARSGYEVAELSSMLAPHLERAAAPVSSTAPTQAPASSPPVGEPVCPKCGVPMVLRTSSRGERQGERFYGCPNYPRCRQTKPVVENHGTG